MLDAEPSTLLLLGGSISGSGAQTTVDVVHLPSAGFSCVRALPDLPFSFSSGAAFILNGEVYIGGGGGDNAEKVFFFNEASWQWERAAADINKIYFSTHALSDDQQLVIGGTLTSKGVYNAGLLKKGCLSGWQSSAVDIYNGSHLTSWKTFLTPLKSMCTLKINATHFFVQAKEHHNSDDLYRGYFFDNQWQHIGTTQPFLNAYTSRVCGIVTSEAGGYKQTYT